MEGSTAEIWTGTRSKRIHGRFRATLAGLLELEVLRVKHKELVEEALEIQESPDHRDDRVTSHQGPYQYWMEESSFRLKLKRGLSNENLSDPGTFLELRRTGVQHSSADPEDLNSHECDDRQSMVSSGFCENQNDAMSSLTTSLASLSHQSTDTSAVYGEEFHTSAIWSPQLIKNKQEHVRKGNSMTQGFSKVVIPEAGFLSVVGLYPDSHWPVISDILQPQVVLEPSYRSDLKSRQGSEVYRYPSPLHAVALQSPLFALQSPEHKRKKERCSPGTFSSETRDSERTRSHNDETTTFTPVTSSSGYLENPRCEEILLKRVRGEMSNHTKAEISGITSWSRRNWTSLQRTCSMGKAGTSSSFKPTLFQNRGTGPFDSSRAPSPRFRGLRRHTAALTNLSIFTERNGSSSNVPEVFMRGTSICSGTSEPIC